MATRILSRRFKVDRSSGVDKLSFPSCFLGLNSVDIASCGSHASLYSRASNQMGHVSQCLGVYDCKPRLPSGYALVVGRFTVINSSTLYIN